MFGRIIGNILENGIAKEANFRATFKAERDAELTKLSRKAFCAVLNISAREIQ